MEVKKVESELERLERYKKKGEEGDPVGQLMTSFILWNNEVGGGEEMSKEWLLKSASNGNELAKIRKKYIGVEGEPDHTRLFVSLKQFWEMKGNMMSEEEKMILSLMLAYYYREGKGGEKDEKRAFEMYEEYHSKGEPVASFWMANCLVAGVGCHKDVQRANELYASASDRKFWSATFQLATHYENGVGVEKNLPKALQMYQLLVEEAGDPQAMFNLASCYSLGNGVEKNLKKAHEYCSMAAEKGFSYPFSSEIFFFLMQRRKKECKMQSSIVR